MPPALVYGTEEYGAGIVGSVIEDHSGLLEGEEEKDYGYHS
jgi:hypothetical protein